jgi:integrase
MAKKRANGEEKKTRRSKGEGSIYQRPDGTWTAQISTGHDPKTGKLIRRTFYGKTRSEVAKKLNSVINQIDKGEYCGPSNVTVEQWFNDWLKLRKPHVEESTFIKYTDTINHHVIPELGQLKLTALKTKHIQDMINTKMESGRLDGKGGLSAKMLAEIRQILRAGLDKAVREHFISFNPAGPKMIEISGIGKKKMQTLDQDEMDKLLETCRSHFLFPAFILESVTGLRRGEILGLKWEDFDHEKRIIHIQRQLTPKNELKEKTKTEGSDRIIVLDPAVVKLLEAHRTQQEQLKKWHLKDIYQDNDLMFCWQDGRSVIPRVFNQHFKILLKKAGITKNIRFHDLRHTAATSAIESGIPIKAVSEMLGHTDVRTTLTIYSHVTDKMRADTAGVLAGRISKHLEKPLAVNKQ